MTGFSAFTAGDWLALSSDVLMMALGVWMLSLRPRTRTTWSFAVFAICFGGQFAVNILWRGVDPGPLQAWSWRIPLETLRLTSVAALAMLVTQFPLPLAAAERRKALLSAGLGVLAMAPLYAHLIANVDVYAPADEWDQGQYIVTFGIFFLVFAAMIGAAILGALRYPAMMARRRPAAGNIALFSPAIFVYPSAWFGYVFDPLGWADPWSPWSIVYNATSFLVPLGLCVLWLINTRVEGGGRWARTAALWMLAPCAIGYLLQVMGVQDNLIMGIARIGTVGTLAFGILRFRLFGLAVRVKKTFAKSTLAAFFVAAFFMGSEAAQSFFGQTSGSQYWGIAAAGALVFVLAPLQRFAERFSDQAMPGAQPAPELADADKHYAYEEAARAAWGDGRLDPYERAMLDRLRARLGLPELDALRIERDAATRGGDPGSAQSAS